MAGILVPPFKLNSATEIVPRSTGITNLTGNTGGLTIAGGDSNAAGTSPLTLVGDKGTPFTGTSAAGSRITIDDNITLLGTNRTYTASPDHVMSLSGTYILDYSGSNFGAVVKFAPTLTAKSSSTTFNGLLFDNAGTLVNDSASAITFGNFAGFSQQATIKADTQTIYQYKEWGYSERTIFDTTNSGILQNQQWYQFYALSQLLGNVKGDARIMVGAGFWREQPTLAGNGFISTNIGFGADNHTVGRDLNYAIQTGTGTVQFSDDVHFFDNTKGPILYDRANGHVYRLYVTSGTLTLEDI